jgi:hypothetical protein
MIPWKEVPSVDNYTTNVAAARVGAACQGARSPWTQLAVVGAKHALAPSAVLAAGRPEARGATFRHDPVQMTQSALMTAELLPTVSDTRKPNNVHKTRIDAGGYGAMGPYPEREQPA